MIYVGIDPGITGAFALLDGKQATMLFDTPTILVERPGKKTPRRDYDCAGMAALLRALDPVDTVVCIEHVQGGVPVKRKPGPDGEPAQGSPGAAGAFRYGSGWGMWLGALAAFKLKHMLVRPQRWQSVMLTGHAKGKGVARIVASQLFAGADLGRKDDGRSCALLMAEYARRLDLGPLE